MLELRIHGRGGQGAVVASKVLAAALFREGRGVQSFPAFGVERRGAPVTAFLRLSDEPILLRCEVTDPDYVIVLDPTLVEAVDVTAGLKPGGTILINSARAPESYGELARRFRVATVDAGAIAASHGLGSRTQPIVNTAILGAFAVDSGLVSVDSVLAAIREEVPSQTAENVAAALEAAGAVRSAGAPGVARAGLAGVEAAGAAEARERAVRGRPLARRGWGGATVPPVAASLTSTRVNRTGSWKYVQPVYRDRVAPCNEACPVGIDIEGYMDFLREGRLEDAIDLLLRENPLPAVTGRVCDHPCEVGCNRGRFDEAVSIHAIERVLGDLVAELGAVVEPARAPGPRRKERVAVVGSGPAGLGCAYFLARLGYRVTVFEAADEAGGMLRLGIPEYRLPRAVLDREIERIRRAGVEIRCGVRVGEELPWAALDEFDAVFLGTGAHRSQPMGVKGEDLPGVRAGLDFLKEVNAGARPDVGRRVVVVGGGNTAMDCARTALRLGAEVTVVYRRGRAEMPAILAEVDEAEREGVRFVFLAAPVAFHAPGGRLGAVECVRMRLGPPDASGRRRPVPTEERFTVSADTVLTAIGEVAEPEVLPRGITREDGAVGVDPLGMTSWPRFFAGGDMAGQPRSVAHALGSGKRAAIGIHRYLRAVAGDEVSGPPLEGLRYGPRGNVSLTRLLCDDPVSRTAPLNEVVPFEDLNVSHFVHVARNSDGHLSPEASRSGFAEVNVGLSRDAALAEARRCFNCGVCNRCELCLIFCPDVAIRRRPNGQGFEIDLEYCKGCGVCVAECPRGAMAMVAVEA